MRKGIGVASTIIGVGLLGFGVYNIFKKDKVYLGLDAFLDDEDFEEDNNEFEPKRFDTVNPIL